MSEHSIAALKDIATKLRIHSIESTTKAGSGHPTSCCSMADLTAALFFDAMKYHVQEPRNPNNDRFILSKGHAAPILYAAWAEAGLFPTERLLTLRQIDSDLEGHPTPKLSFVDMATGSLGQGLSAGAGMAYSAKYMEKSESRTYVLIGDGESAEGSVWEALSFASHYELDNLCAIFDINRLGQSEPTMFQHHMEVYRDRLTAFGWHAIVIDGHDMATVTKAFDEAAATKGKPTAILAKTFKGHGIPGIEDHESWHGKALSKEAPAALESLRSQLTGANGLKPKAPADKVKPFGNEKITLAPPAYKKGDMIATRAAYGTALTKAGNASKRVVGMDGDTKNSTYSLKLKEAHPDQFVECFIAEQNLVGVAVGMAARGHAAFASTFACFLSRAFDQIRMAGISQSSVNLVGSHCGVSIGEDGPSQMALEDLSMFRTIPHCVVFYPFDAVATEKAIELAANYSHMTFTRTSRPATPVIYDNNETFEIGKAKVVRSSGSDKLTIVAAGITLFESLKAADTLAAEGINVRVIDPFTIKPLDRETILASAKETGGTVLTVEDHYPEGGIGDAVAGELSGTGIHVVKVAVREIPHSGKPEELLAKFGIDASHIVAKVKELIG